MPRSTRDADVSQDLRKEIHRTGYYPEVVADGVFSAAGGEEVVSYFVHHETTFDHEEVRRHLTALLLTGVFLLLRVARRATRDRLGVALYCLALTLPLQLLLSNVFAGPVGAVTWFALSLAVRIAASEPQDDVRPAERVDRVQRRDGEPQLVTGEPGRELRGDGDADEDQVGQARRGDADPAGTEQPGHDAASATSATRRRRPRSTR